MSSPKPPRLPICFINHLFAPSEAASAVILSDLSKLLAAQFRLSVVCGIPGPVTSEEVKRFGTFLPKSRGFFWKLLDYLYFLFRVTLTLLFARRDGTIYVLFSDPPFVDTILGWLCGARRIPYLVVVQDYYPEFALHSGLLNPGPLYRSLVRKHVEVLRKARKVIYSCQDYRRILVERGAPEGPVIDYWCSPKAIRVYPLAKQNLAAHRQKFVVRYSGNFGNACDLEGFFAALKCLPDRSRYVFIFQGDGIKHQWLARRCQEFTEVDLAPWTPREKLSETLADCHAQLILTPARLLGSVYSSKLFTIMAAARPVIASIPARSSMHQFIRQQNIGLSAPSESAEALAATLTTAREIFLATPERWYAYGENGRRYIEEIGNEEVAARSFAQEFRAIQGR